MLSIKKIGVIGRTYRHINRYRQVLAVFIKYGLGGVIDRLNIDQYIEIGINLFSGSKREKVEKLKIAERVRMAFEELGPTFIKFGQILSTRPGLLPADFMQELSRLQDKVPPFPFAEVKQIIELELGSPLEALFESFDEEPVASASIGQVHRARLKTNGDVAVKVQRPGIKRIIEVDLEIMLHLATLTERNIAEISHHRPTKIVEEFARTLEKEIDYTVEASNMERFDRQFMSEPTIYVPKVIREATTSRVITMEYVEGIKVTDISRLKDAGLDPKIITARGADLILKQVFDHGFFHADPHPGNFFVLPDNVICFLDFGMMGSIDRQTQETFVDLIDSIVSQDPYETTRVILRLTEWDHEPDLRFLEREVSEFMGQHLYKPLKDIEIGKLLQQLMELSFRHRLRIPPDLFLMIKAISAVEGIGSRLDPDFDMISKAAPFIAELKIARFHPRRVANDILKMAVDLRQFAQQFPQDILNITQLIKQRKLSIRIEHAGFEHMLSTHDQISNRISFSIIIAALLIGSALIVISKTPPLIYGISLIGIIGFLAALVLGVWLLVAILRKGRL